MDEVLFTLDPKADKREKKMASDAHFDPDFLKKISGYKRVTAIILYYLPDHPTIITPNPILWQTDDLPPSFPVLNQFVERWEAGVEARLHSIRIAITGIISPTELKYHKGEFTLQ